MVKKSSLAIVLVCILVVITLIVIFIDSDNDGRIDEFSNDNHIACVEDEFVASIDEKGGIKIVGKLSEEFDFSGWENIVSLVAGMGNVAGLKEDYTVVMTGSNYNNKNEVGEWRGIIMVALSPMATFGLKEDGTVVYAGDYKEGGLVDMARVYDEVGNWRDITYIDAGTFGVAGVTKSGEVAIICGMPLLEQEVQKWTDIRVLSFEGSRIIAIKNNGEVIVCEETPNDGLLYAYPYPDFEGAVKVCTNRDLIACLMPDGTVKVGVGLDSMNEQTILESQLFSTEYSSITRAKDIVDIDCSYHYLTALKSNGDILIK